MNAAESGASLLHIWLITDGGDGVSFMADIGVMLRRMTERKGGGFAPGDHAFEEDRADSLHFLAQLSPEAVPILQGEVGIHRGQLAPTDREDGRVCTSLVAVELLPPGSAPSDGRPNGPVLKTYNYALQRVTYHPTGAILPLATVLKGDVG